MQTGQVVFQRNELTRESEPSSRCWCDALWDRGGCAGNPVWLLRSERKSGLSEQRRGMYEGVIRRRESGGQGARRYWQPGNGDLLNTGGGKNTPTVPPQQN